MKYYDREIYACLKCKHRWVLGSNKAITNEQHITWLQEAIKQHNEIQYEEEK